jgi:WD40 repeat protein
MCYSEPSFVKRLLLCVSLVIMAAVGGATALLREANAQNTTSEQEDALRLAFHAQAELSSHDDSGLVRSVLLAAESLRRTPTVEIAETLQAGLMLLPRRIYEWPPGLRSDLVSGDDRWLILRGDASHELWELPAADNTLTEPRRITQLPLDDGTKGVAFGPGDDWLISWSAERLQIWRVNDGKPAGAWTPDLAPINQVKLSTDKHRLFLIGETGIQVLDMSNVPRLRETASIPRENAATGYAISPDGRFAAVVSGDGTQVDVWQAENGKLAQVIPLSRKPEQLLFHPHGTHLVGSDEAAVHIWDVESGAEVATVETERAWPGVAFSTTGEWLVTPAVSGHGDVDVFAFPPDADRLTAADSVLHTWNGDSAGLAFKFSPGDRWLLRFEDCSQKRCSATRDVTVWDMESSNPDDRELNLTLAGRIDDASFSPDGASLLTVHTSSGYVSQVWRLPDGEEVMRLPGYRSQLSPGGRWLLGYDGDDGPLQLWAADPGRHWNPMRHDSTYFTGYGAGPLAFSRDGRWLVTGGVDNRVRVWDAASGEQVAALAHKDIYYLDLQAGIRTLALSPDGQTLASLNDGGDLWLWDLSVLASPTITVAQPIAQFKTPPWSSVTFSPDSRWLLADYGAWNVVTGETRYGPELYGGYALSPDGQWIASRKDDAITLRRFASGEINHQFEHKDGLGNLVFGPDGRRLVSVGRETIYIWQTGSGNLVHQLKLDGQLQGYEISPDNRWIAVGNSGGPPVVWDIESGEAVSRLATSGVAAAPIAFSPDGQLLAVRDPQGHICVFDVTTGTEIASLPRTVRFGQTVFTPSGKRLATTDAQGYVRFWFWQPEDLVAEACQHLPRNLTIEEWQRYFGQEPYRSTCSDLPATMTGEAAGRR